MVKELTPEETKVLQESPYVRFVRSGMVFFTDEFKAILYRRLLEGQSVRSTLQVYGIDPGILGDRRIWNLAHTIRAEARKESHQEIQVMAQGKEPGSKERELAKQVERLQTELAYMREEVDFLKRLRAADLEARKAWKDKHRQK